MIESHLMGDNNLSLNCDEAVSFETLILLFDFEVLIRSGRVLYFSHTLVVVL